MSSTLVKSLKCLLAEKYFVTSNIPDSWMSFLLNRLRLCFGQFLWSNFYDSQYLRRGGYVIVVVCLCVCLSQSVFLYAKYLKKVMNGFYDVVKEECLYVLGTNRLSHGKYPDSFVDPETFCQQI